MAKKRGGGGPTVGKTRPKKGSPPPPTRPVQRGQYKSADYDLEEYLREISPDNGRGGLARDLSDIGLLPETDDGGIRRPLHAMLMEHDPGLTWDNLRPLPDLELGPTDWEGGVGGDIDPIDVEQEWRPEFYPDLSPLNAEMWDEWDDYPARVRGARLGGGARPDFPLNYPAPTDQYDVGPEGDILPNPPDGSSLNFDAVGGLMDLLQTPGFKIGLGGTAALTAVLSYLGSQAIEEITP